MCGKLALIRSTTPTEAAWPAAGREFATGSHARPLAIVLATLALAHAGGEGACVEGGQCDPESDKGRCDVVDVIGASH